MAVGRKEAAAGSSNSSSQTACQLLKYLAPTGVRHGGAGRFALRLRTGTVQTRCPQCPSRTGVKDVSHDGLVGHIHVEQRGALLVGQALHVLGGAWQAGEGREERAASQMQRYEWAGEPLCRLYSSKGLAVCAMAACNAG